MSFRSFIPPKINEYLIDDSVFSAQTNELDALFGNLRENLEAADKDTRLRLLTNEAADSEALASNRPMNPFAFSLPGVGNDEERDNIIRATEYGASALDDLPLSSRLIRNLHYLVCDSPAYDRKYKGEFRTSPVWIGKPGCSISDAEFVPPINEDMTKALTDLENYINYDESNPFVKAAVIHYQFEMIHPFIDANGRVGRIINTLFLKGNGVLNYPILLLSKPLLRSGIEYPGGLQYVNKTGNVAEWIRYYLNVIKAACQLTLSQLIPGDGISFIE